MKIVLTTKQHKYAVKNQCNAVTKTIFVFFSVVSWFVFNNFLTEIAVGVAHIAAVIPIRIAA